MGICRSTELLRPTRVSPLNRHFLNIPDSDSEQLAEKDIKAHSAFCGGSSSRSSDREAALQHFHAGIPIQVVQTWASDLIFCASVYPL